MIMRLNRIHRSIPGITDVLSFPLTEQKPGKKLKFSGNDLSEAGRVCLGDIVLCLPQALRQAKEYGHGLEREIAYLTAHSVLHLLGYDHTEELDKRLMRKREEAIMAKALVRR
jgi:probable rRNA maturation factor